MPIVKNMMSRKDHCHLKLAICSDRCTCQQSREVIPSVISYYQIATFRYCTKASAIGLMGVFSMSQKASQRRLEINDFLIWKLNLFVFYSSFREFILNYLCSCHKKKWLQNHSNLLMISESEHIWSFDCIHEHLAVIHDSDSFMAMQFPTNCAERNWLFGIEIGHISDFSMIEAMSPLNAVRDHYLFRDLWARLGLVGIKSETTVRCVQRSQNLVIVWRLKAQVSGVQQILCIEAPCHTSRTVPQL
jgi:hypothetical protein